MRDKIRTLVRPTSRSAAIHEAGHVAIDWFFGLNIVEVSVFRGGGRSTGLDPEEARGLFHSRYGKNAAFRFPVYECISCLAGLIAQYRWQHRNVLYRMNEILDSIDLYSEDIDIVSAKGWAEETWEQWRPGLRCLVEPTLDILRQPSVWTSCRQLAELLLISQNVNGQDALGVFCQNVPPADGRTSVTPADDAGFWEWPAIVATVGRPLSIP